MSAALARLTARLEALTLRERALLLGVGVVLMVASWDGVVLRPLEAERERVGTREEQLRQDLAALDQQAAEIRTRLARDSSAPVRERNAGMRQQIERLDGRLRSEMDHLVSPAEMSRVLEELLERQESLVVSRLEALPAEPMLGGLLRAGSVAGLGASVYRHGMRIELEGRFPDVVAFLETMESLPWSLFWDRLHYEVTEYPVARVTLVVNTLSTEEGWIGV